MKKRASVLGVLLIMLLVVSVSGCGAKEELREYTQVSHELYPMPDSIVTEQELREAWKSVISHVLDGGVTFKGEPVAAMTPAYMLEVAEDSEYFIMDSLVYDVNFLADNYSLSADTKVFDDVLIGFESGEVINEIRLSAPSLDAKDGTLEAETIEEIKGDFKIGNAIDVLGLTTEEMLEALEITSDMFNTLRDMQDDEMSWCEDSDGYAYWKVSFNEFFDGAGHLFHTLSLYRIDKAHYQYMGIIAVDKCVETIEYGEIFYTEEQKEEFSASAEAVLTEEKAKAEAMAKTEAVLAEVDLTGRWETTEDTSVFIEIGNSNLGIIYLPGVTNDISAMNLWADTEEAADNREYTLFEIEVLSFEEVVATLELRYNAEDQSATLTDKDNSFSYVLYKTN